MKKNLKKFTTKTQYHAIGVPDFIYGLKVMRKSPMGFVIRFYLNKSAQLHRLASPENLDGQVFNPEIQV